MRLKDRFEVFKRDGFQCQYCGRKVPDVVLEVDHVVPVAAGGADDLVNLITSCFDCNRGKGKRELSALTDSHELQVERELQVAEYYEAQRRTQALIEAQVDGLEEPWGYTFTTQERASIKMFVRSVGLTRVYEAIDIAVSRGPRYPSHRFRYLCGILHNWRRDMEACADGQSTD